MMNSDFIIFLDDDNTKKELYVDIIEITASLIKFKTYSNNTIIIPINRVLKIKRKENTESGGEHE